MKRMDPMFTIHSFTQRKSYACFSKTDYVAEISGNHLVGNVYSRLLEDTVDPRLTDVFENDKNLMENELIFQLDGAAPH